MSRFINVTVIVLIALCSKPLFAQKIFTLNPNESKKIANTAPWALNANCTVQVSNQAKSRIKVNVVKNTCTVNGKNLGQGQATSVTITNNTNISVSADAGTEINLVNMGSVELRAVCST